MISEVVSEVNRNEKIVLVEFKDRFKIQGLDVECRIHLSPGKMTLLSGDNGIGKSSLIQFLKLNQSEFFSSQKLVFIDQFPLSPVNDISYLELENFLSSKRIEKLACYIELREKLSSFIKKPIKSLSGGQNQLIKIALGLFLGGDVFILDEPFQYLDKSNVLLLKKLLQDLKFNGRIILIVEHRKEIIAQLIDESFEMIKGNNLKVLPSGS
jgi:ABC-type Mn2+/Zn2+ transport system ATPase subunit